MTEGAPPRQGPSPPGFTGRLYAFIDWFITDAATRRDPDALRRARLLVSSAFVFALPALAFFEQTRAAWGLASAVPIAFGVTALLFLATPFLLRATGSTTHSGGFLTLVCLTFDLFIACASGGFEVSALLWTTTTPLLAAFFVGGRFSVLVAVLAAAGTTTIFFLDRAGFPFPMAPTSPEAATWFALQSLLDVTLLIGFVGWLYEQQAARGLRQVHRELLEAHAALQERESRYRSLTEEASDAILVTRPSGRLIEANERACALTGYAREELLDTFPDQLLYGDGPFRYDLLFTRLKEGGVLRHEVEVVRKDGTVFPAEVSLRAVAGEFIQAIVRDASERRRYEAGLVEAKEHAEQMNRLKTAFLANMSHEIRTPLTSILGFAELLTDAGDGYNRRFAGLILRNGRRLMDTLNSVLDLAQIESGTLRLRHEPLDAAALVHETVQLMQPLADERALYLVVEAPPGPAPVVVDPSALERVLANLISNALKFTRKGGVTVRVDQAAEEVSLAVADTGIGIGQAFLPYLFDEFEQESQGFRRSHEGVGLGLTITRRLVELMNGRIEVTSEPGRGSTFTVRFPRRSTPLPAEALVPADVPELVPENVPAENGREHR